MWRRAISILLGVFVPFSAVFALLYLALRAVHFLGSLDEPLIVAIFTASATVLASTIAVVAGKIFERKKEIESHFRQRKFDQSYELLKLISELTAQQATEVSVSDNVVKRLTEWHRNLILFAGPKTIRCYSKWFGNLKSGHHTLQTIVLMEEFYKALRSDLGISNFGLKDGDMAHLITGHGDLFMMMLRENPNMTLVELVEREKLRDAKRKSNVT